MTIYGVQDRETISSLTTAVGFTAAKLAANPMYATIQAVGGDCRFCTDGTTPTADLGIRLQEDGSCEIWGSQAMTDFRCIDDTGAATLEVVYMGR
jgi:hypothetical protein